MGRNKIKIERIKNERIRQVTFYKRKRGLLKKAMELSLLCDVKVLMLIVDKNEKVTLYSSETNYKNLINSYLIRHSMTRDLIYNNDYKDLFNEGSKNPELTDSKESDKDNEESSEEEKISVTKSRWRKNVTPNLEDIHSNEPNKETDEMLPPDKNDSKSDFLNNFTKYPEISKEEGLSKIKKKLSLKVVIPEEKRKHSWPDGNGLNKEQNRNNEKIESTKNLNDLLENTNPLSIFSQTILQNEFIGHKKHPEENENNNNYNNFSPNFSAGSLKAISPFFNPTPNLQNNGGLSNFFMFNNNIFGTPLKSVNNGNNINFHLIGNNSTNNNLIITSNSLMNNTNTEEINKNVNNLEDIQPGKLNVQSNNTVPSHLNLNNQNPSHSTIIIPKISIRDDSNLVGIPTPGRNLGFYSWVIHGSPVLQNNPLVNSNLNTHNRKSTSKKRKNVKKIDEV